MLECDASLIIRFHLVLSCTEQLSSSRLALHQSIMSSLTFCMASRLHHFISIHNLSFTLHICSNSSMSVPSMEIFLSITPLPITCANYRWLLLITETCAKQTISSGNGGLQLNRLIACRAAFGGYIGGGGGCGSSCDDASDFLLCSDANRRLASLKCRSWYIHTRISMQCSY